ncbi:luciferase family protein [Falsihalocynthiibacter sp. S25ZX9]|uniref:luciferase domain-containing protein n=1 Tax=Falsihalocynthiibacter sp. S25ZX9 TaxID=3240870 RepID=UPI00350EE928
MIRFSQRFTILAAASLFACVTPAFAQDVSIPNRDGPRPETTNGVPHIQLGLEAVPELTEVMLKQVAELSGVTLGSTRVSLPGAVGFQLNTDIILAEPDAIVGGREFAHVHPDGSLHASLEPELARAAVNAGWATPHPWADQRPRWEGFVMIYTPTTKAELDVVHQLVRGSYTYVTGLPAP